MKNHFKTNLALLFVLAIPSLATPVYYTFSGIVTVVNGVAPNVYQSFNVGQTVQYTFLVDLNLPGQYAFATFEGGPIQSGLMEDYDNYDHFYANYVSGSAYSEDATCHHCSVPFYERTWGVTDNLLNNTYLLGVNEDHLHADLVQVTNLN